MASELRLPDLGEDVEDVTISAWRVQEGDTVNVDDVLLEVATDKVDTEVPATSSGTVLKIFFGEGEIVPADAVLAAIGEPGERVDSGSTASEDDTGAVEEVDTTPEGDETAAGESAGVSAAPSTDGVKASPVAVRVASDKHVALEQVAGTGPGGRITKDDVLAHAGAGAKNGDVGDNSGADDAGVATLPEELANVPPLEITRVAAFHNIDLATVADGRPLSTLTRYDVLEAVGRRDGVAIPDTRYLPPADWQQSQSSSDGRQPSSADSAKPEPARQASRAKSESVTSAAAKADEELVKHSRMRAAVARSTSQSAFTAPHVTTMWDVNMSAVLAHRKAHKAEFGAAGVNLTVTAYFIAAIVEGLKAVPAANATWTDEGVIIKRTYNIGMAVALPMDEYGMGGLIVPVIKHAGDLNLMGLARAVNDYAAKARAGDLAAADLADGTFTLSNYGTSGSRFQTPVIVQPQVGILGVGAIEKRPVVVSQGHPLEANTGDYMAFLPMTTLGFSYDHRVLDGATADAFCAAVKQSLEGWSD